MTRLVPPGVLCSGVARRRRNRMTGPLRQVAAAIIGALAVGWMRHAVAQCPTARILPQVSDPVAVAAEARIDAVQGRYAEARALYRSVLDRDPASHEAALALARLD